MIRPEVSAQLTAIADLRWRMFLNGLRSKRGKMELASRTLITLVFTIGGIGASSSPPSLPGISSRKTMPNILPFCCGRFFSSGNFSQ